MAANLLARAILIAALGVASPPPIHLSVSPTVAMAPASVHLELRVPRCAVNRVLRVETEGPDFERLSAWDIDGVNAPYLYVVEWVALPEGDYQIIASLWSATGLLAMDRASVLVR